MREGPCAGCGEELQGYYAYVTLHEKQYRMCRGRNRDLPSAECLKALLAGQTKCPGCGAESRYGSLCRDCRRTLDDARKREGYVERLMPRYAMPRAFGREDELDGLLAQAVCPEAANTCSYPPGTPFVCLPEKHNSGYERPYRWLVSITPAQEKALARFVEVVSAAFEQTRREARAEGRSLLNALANGEVTAAQYDDKAARQDEGKDR